MSGRVGFGMFSMKKVRATYAAESAQRDPQVLVIARRHNAAAALAKAGDALTVGHTQPITIIDREQPQLVKVGLIKTAQNRIVAGCVSLAITRLHVTELVAGSVFDRTQLIAQQRKPADVPVVFGEGNGSLQQDANRSCHREILSTIVRSVPGAVATGSQHCTRPRSHGQNPVATAPGTDLIAGPAQGM